MILTINTEIDSQALADAFVSAVEGNHMIRAWVDSILVADDVAEKYGLWYAEPEFWDTDYTITVKHDGPNSP